jgi:hypothetical protein
MISSVGAGPFPRRGRRLAHIANRKSHGKSGKAPLRVGDMRTLRIAAQIGPISFACIDAERSSPSNRFTPHRYDGAYAHRQRAVWMGRQKFRVAIERIACQRCRESLAVARKVADATPYIG